MKVDAGGIGFEFEVADENSLNFEQHLIDLSARESGKDDITIIVFTARSFNDVSFQTIFFDVWKMLGGYVIMFTFTYICAFSSFSGLETVPFATTVRVSGFSDCPITVSTPGNTLSP